MAGTAAPALNDREVSKSKTELVTNLLGILRQMKVMPGTTPERLEAADQIETALQESLLTREAAARG